MNLTLIRNLIVPATSASYRQFNRWNRQHQLSTLIPAASSFKVLVGWILSVFLTARPIFAADNADLPLSFTVKPEMYATGFLIEFPKQNQGAVRGAFSSPTE